MLQRPGAVVPETARFFRGQMQTIITKALGDVGIKPLPSRRCFSIMSEWCKRGGEGGAWLWLHWLCLEGFAPADGAWVLRLQWLCLGPVGESTGERCGLHSCTAHVAGIV